MAAASLLRSVAVGAVNGPIVPGLERHLGVFAALGANRRVHLAFATVAATAAVATAAAVAAAVACGLASGAAVGAATGGGETLRLVEFLFALGERKLLSAVDAGEVLV